MRIGGIALIAGSLAFMAVFIYLAAAFGYPDILDRSAAEVLPRLLQGGRTLRTVWFIYGALPLIFLIAGAASGRILERAAPGLRTPGVAAAVAAGLAMMAGLLRWPTIEWTLARYWNGAAGSEKVALNAVFDASNLFLGTLIGEFVGEVCLAAWFFALAIAWRRDGRRVFGGSGIAAAILMAVAALRNITSAVDPIAAVNNFALPAWMIAMGIAFLRDAPVGAPVTSGVAGGRA